MDHEHCHHDHCNCEHDHDNHAHCSCQHDHCSCEQDHESCGCGCGCGHDHDEQDPKELRSLLLGAGLFAAGIVFQLFSLGVAATVTFGAACLLLGWEIFISAGKSLFRGRMLDENFLMSIAAIGAFAIGEFPEAVGILLFYRVGEMFEHRAVARSRKRITEAVDMRPETVLLENGQTIPAGQAQAGDVLLVRPGDRSPLDGTVVRGESRLDTSPITGEPVPVGVGAGDPVTSGCINLSGQLTMRVEKPLQDSTVTRILEAMEHAAAGKPKIDRFISRFARIYTPLVVAVALLTAIVPSLITGQWNYWVYTALSFLVMSCPCALVLSVPLAFFSGIGAGSKRGILFKDGASIEALAGIRTAALDKTGTVTRGEFRVQPCDPALLALCASCEQSSSHPIAASILRAAQEQNLTLQTPDSMEEIPGHGIRAILDGKTVLCGNEKLLTRFGVCFTPPIHTGTAVLVALDGEYLGALVVSDTVKEDAAQAVRKLEAMGIQTAILTGDADENARAVAREVGIRQVFSRLLPENKLECLQKLRQDNGAVLFVGDGINDAPVLAGADVGAAMGSGADAAIQAADVVFMTSRMGAVPEAVALARRTRQIAVQNVIFAIGVKALVMVLGLLGFADLWLAVFADTGVALLCVLNSIRILYQKR